MTQKLESVQNIVLYLKFYKNTYDWCFVNLKPKFHFSQFFNFFKPGLCNQLTTKILKETSKIRETTKYCKISQSIFHTKKNWEIFFNAGNFPTNAYFDNSSSQKSSPLCTIFVSYTVQTSSRRVIESFNFSKNPLL